MNKAIVDGKEVNVKIFKTKNAADNFISKKGGEIVFYKAGFYMVKVA
jgi:hypothetical protein